MAFALEDPEPLLLHDEPIWRDGERVGLTSSGAFGHTLGRSCGLGWIDWGPDDDERSLGRSEWKIEIACMKHRARASLRPLYDRRSERVRA